MDQDERVTPDQFSFCIFEDYKRIHLGSCVHSVVSKSRYFIAFMQFGAGLALSDGKEGVYYRALTPRLRGWELWVPRRLF
jgi:hypothetical protein